ncbi:hypothetical protein FDG2_0418 [Candidatus Protofrankia californiensis]|uniref:Uncharacterized protein n=1 Tax=Candidatus Protofrankia californiensis TaxID=1839754 RepID=A0A1C3NTH3_9ACTN|nr:hypothetical protein FDG2_0418 [Candidatus Protofrankia californiensis]
MIVGIRPERSVTVMLATHIVILKSMVLAGGGPRQPLRRGPPVRRRPRPHPADRIRTQKISIGEPRSFHDHKIDAGDDHPHPHPHPRMTARGRCPRSADDSLPRTDAARASPRPRARAVSLEPVGELEPSSTRLQGETLRIEMYWHMPCGAVKSRSGHFRCRVVPASVAAYRSIRAHDARPCRRILVIAWAMPTPHRPVSPKTFPVALCSRSWNGWIGPMP